MGQGTCRGLGDTRTVLGIALGMNAFHLALDPLLIYGAGWGVSGEFCPYQSDKRTPLSIYCAGWGVSGETCSFPKLEKEHCCLARRRLWRHQWIMRL